MVRYLTNITPVSKPTYSYVIQLVSGHCMTILSSTPPWQARDTIKEFANALKVVNCYRIEESSRWVKLYPLRSQDA